jgi:hypothetical protein
LRESDDGTFRRLMDTDDVQAVLEQMKEEYGEIIAHPNHP